MSAAEPFAPGELVDGRYRVEHQVGVGGMGVVYKARDEGRGVPVALKAIRPELAEPTLLLRLQREGELLARGAGGGVVRVESMGRHRGLPFMALAWVDGDDLNQLLGERGGRLDLDDALALAERLARTLAACHAAGVIHRDVKPANVLLPRGPQGLHDLSGALLADFGLAWTADAERLSRTADVLGTPAYMAPEQGHGAAASHDCRVDVWGVGAVLFHALTGGPPHGDGPDALARLARDEAPAPGVSPGVDRVVLRALARDPDARYPTALALADDLARLRRGEPPLAGSPVRRRAARGLAIGLSGAVALVGVAWGGEAARRGARARELEELVAGHRAFVGRTLAPWNLGLGRGPAPTREALDAQAAALRALQERGGAEPAELARGQAWLAAARRRVERRVEPPATDARGALGDALGLLDLDRPKAALQAARAAAGELPMDAAAVAGRVLAGAPDAVLELPPELVRRAPALASPVREALERAQADALRRAVRGEPGPGPADVAAAGSRLAPALEPGLVEALARARLAEVDLSAEGWTAALLRASGSSNPGEVLLVARRLGDALAGPPAVAPGPALEEALDRLVARLADGVSRASRDDRARPMLQAARLLVALCEELPGQVAAAERPARREAVARLLDGSLSLVDLSSAEVPLPIEFVLLRLAFDPHEVHELRRLGERLAPGTLAEALARWPRSRALRVIAAARDMEAYEEELEGGARREVDRTRSHVEALEAALAPEGATLDLAEVHVVRALRLLGELHLDLANARPAGAPAARPSIIRGLELLDRALPVLLRRGLIDEHHDVLNLIAAGRQQLEGREAGFRLWEETADFDRARLAEAEADPAEGVIFVLERMRTLAKTLARLAEERAVQVGAPGPALDQALRAGEEAREKARAVRDGGLEGRAVAAMLLAERRARLLDAACARVATIPAKLQDDCDHRLLREAYECLRAAGRGDEAAIWLERLRTRFPIVARDLQGR